MDSTPLPSHPSRSAVRLVQKPVLRQLLIFAFPKQDDCKVAEGVWCEVKSGIREGGKGRSIEGYCCPRSGGSALCAVWSPLKGHHGS